MPRRKKKPDAHDYLDYSGLYGPEMRRRAIAAGCRTPEEVYAWQAMWYGATSDREENHTLAPGPWRRKPESGHKETRRRPK